MAGPITKITLCKVSRCATPSEGNKVCKGKKEKWTENMHRIELTAWRRMWVLSEVSMSFPPHHHTPRSWRKHADTDTNTSVEQNPCTDSPQRSMLFSVVLRNSYSSLFSASIFGPHIQLLCLSDKTETKKGHPKTFPWHRQRVGTQGSPQVILGSRHRSCEYNDLAV